MYRRASRLFDELAQARADGMHPHLLRGLAKAQVLILGAFGLEPLGASERKELLEVLEDGYGVGAPWRPTPSEERDDAGAGAQVRRSPPTARHGAARPA